MKLVLVLSLLFMVAACDHFEPKEVKAWQRGTLAREDMQIVTNPVQNGLDEHIYFSKEAASGGSSIGGGGCGCN